MRVSVLRSPGDVVVEHRPRPRPGPDEVLVRVSSVGVCGSDTHYYDRGRIGSFVATQPLVLGHEASGVIEEVGHLVDRPLGQRVSIEPGVPDRTCEQCLAGRYNLCPGMRFFATPPVDGAFAEYVTVHHAFAHPVPDALGDDAAALLEPLSVGIWACRKAAVTAGSRVLVTGAGPIGLICLQTALALGATDVTVADISPSRLERAREFGATQVLDVATESARDLPNAPTVLLECSGAATATIDGISALRPAGYAVLIGMGAENLALPVAHIQRNEILVTGTFRYANTWPAAIELAVNGRVQLDSLVTGHYGLDEVPAALTAPRLHHDALKVIVHPTR